MLLLRSTFMPIWLFLLVFAPVFKIGDIKLNSSYLFILVPGIIGFFHFYFKKEKNILINNLLKILIISGLFLFMRQSVALFIDISIIRDLFIGFILFFSSYFYVKLNVRIHQNNFYKNIINDLYLVGLLHAFIVVFIFLFPSIKSTIYDFIWVTPKAAKYLFGESSGYRFQGIVQSGFSYLSTTHALFFILGIMKFKLKTNPSILKIGNHLLCQMIILLSIVLIGRTGLFLLIIFYFCYIVYGIYRFLSQLSFSKIFFKILTLFIFFLFAIIVNIDFSAYEKQLKFAFEIFFNYLESGRFSSKSTDILIQNEYFLPSNLLEIIVGTGKYSVASDVGWVRFIFGSGIIGIFIAYSIYYSSGFYAFKYYRIMPLFANFILFYIILLIPLNFKDVYYFSMGSTQIYFLILFTFIFYVDKKIQIHRL
jgi:hypothetical protein